MLCKQTDVFYWIITFADNILYHVHENKFDIINTITVSKLAS